MKSDWIPTDERLPKPNKRVLVDFRCSIKGLPGDYREISAAEYNGSRWKVEHLCASAYAPDEIYLNCVYAWMPLPDHYDESIVVNVDSE
jgi:hypothetical protein